MVSDFPDNICITIAAFVAAVVLIFGMINLRGCEADKAKFHAEHSIKLLEKQYELKMKVVEHLKIPPHLFDRLESEYWELWENKDNKEKEAEE